MKKEVSLILAMLLVLTITACDGNSDSGTLSRAEQNNSQIQNSTNSTASNEETQDSLKDDISVGSESEAMQIESSTKPESDVLLKVIIQIGSTSFTASLYDNASTQALLTQMPMTLNMSEMNGNEKYYYLPENLPSASEQIGSIKAGDLMLYGSDCLVLFYENFSTSYSYTKLGYIDDVSSLAEALSSGSVEVIWAIAE